MPADPDRQALYDRIRTRFVDEPDFRTELRADPVTVLTGVLGELTEAERAWVDGVLVGVLVGSSPEDDLIATVSRKGPPVGAW